MIIFPYYVILIKMRLRGNVLAEIYNYYYIGEEMAGSGAEFMSSPVLLTFSKIKNGPPEDAGPHTHPYLEVFYFESGKGWFEAGEKKTEISAGDVVAVNAGKRHMQYSLKEAPLTYYCFSATNAVFSAVGAPDAVSDAGFVVVKKEKTKEIYRLIEKCKAELDSLKPGRLEAATSYFRLLLIELFRAGGPLEREQTPALPQKIKTYLEAHCNEDISLSDLSRMFYVNKSTLLHSFRQSFGTSPIRYLNNYRIEMSKKLLSDGQSVTAAAIASGFSNPVYFTELFHKRTGLTPSAFKKISCVKKN